jgi:hypothetical protein
MLINEISTITEDGIGVKGTVNTGMLGIRKKVVGIDAELVGGNAEPKQVSIITVELSNKSHGAFATEGDKTHALLDGVAEDEVFVGQVLRGLPLSKYLFYMPIESTFASGKVSGFIEVGKIRKNDKVEIVGEGRTPFISCVKDIEIGHRKVSIASKGDAAFISLEGYGEGNVKPNQTLCIMVPTQEELQKAAEIVKPKILRDKENMKQFQIHEDWRKKNLCGYCGGKISILGSCKPCNKNGGAGRNGWDSHGKYERIKELDLGMAYIQSVRERSNEKGIAWDKTTESKLAAKCGVEYNLGFSAEDYHIHSNILTNTDSGEE